MLAKNIKLLTWFNFFTDFRFYFPIAIIYFSQVTGSFAAGMTIFGATQLVAAIAELPTGIFSDYIGRKRTVIIGAIFSTIAVTFYALGFNYFTLILGAICEGIARSFYSGNNDALLHDSLKEQGKEDEYHHYYGKLSSMFQASAAIAALAGGLIAAYSFHLVFWISLIPQLICIYLAFQLVDPKIIARKSGNIYSHLSEAIKTFLKNPKLRLLSFADIWAFGFGEAGYQFRPAFINMVWPVWALGIPGVLSSLGATVGFWYSGKIIGKFGATKILFFTSIYDKIVGIIALVFVSVFSPLLMTTTSLNFGLRNTATNSLMHKEFTDHQRATMSSLNTLVGSLLFAVTSFFIGLVADKLNPAQALLMIQIFTILNIFIYWKLFTKKEATV